MYLNSGLNTGLNLVGYSNNSSKSDDLVIRQLSTIWLPDYSGIQIPVVIGLSLLDPDCKLFGGLVFENIGYS